MKPLVIRADAGGVLGTGHVMRMTALAQAYMRRGGRVVMASVRCPEPVVDRVLESGIEHQLLHGCDLGDAQDAASSLRLCKQLGAEWMVVDGYHFDESYQKQVSGHGIKLLAVDDYGHCATWHCDAVLNQNLGSEKWPRAATYNPDMQWLMGSSFALIREEFLDSMREAKETVFPARRILVTMGGADPDNVTLMVLNALEQTKQHNLEVRVLAGGANSHQKELEAWAERSQNQVEILCNVREMPAMYEWADAVISAGGSTCWEWIAYGLPGAVVTIADNQVPVVKELENQQLALSLAWHSQFDAQRWSSLLITWLTEGTCGSGFHQLRKVVDGYGASRVASLLDSGLWCRMAQPDDVKLYFDWANDPAVRENSFNREVIKYTDHKQWFNNKLKDSLSVLVVIYDVYNAPLGQVRFDKDASKGCWHIDYSIDESYRGRGLGKAVLQEGITFLRWHVELPLVVSGVVKLVNSASSNVFERLGFSRECINSECCMYELKLI